MKSQNLTFKETDQIIKLLKSGKVGVMPTDTIYGIVGLALNPKTVEEIYSLRKRTTDKPMIILISSIEDLRKFDIKITKAQTDFLKKIWPNPVSVILPCLQDKFSYLHRDKKSLAFRIPKNEILQGILKKVGPLVAPSTNFEDSKPAETIHKAKQYFGDKVSFYVDGGKLKSKPSTIVRLYKDGTRIVLREGTYRV
ncbi:MAG: L-threonylcarbamoyladenylate synthase [Candidatus Daviesbacteria bacterium]|nr:L-threonylcarbamoyladenylate synthase [Candidatus Daviesbacteria bacterium]